ncbi:MAG: DNA helicase PcrA [Firmicutes bacterium]|uniref:ATP-dependent DNA helicase n=1 Tax=Candidatus Scybalomonas excrementavium TaxID=2840943 RepID=A0A9D9N6U4_9FIRM|nr:DNA helicase PcrA [Candidatus Scybalomonas excrementavium]
MSIYDTLNKQQKEAVFHTKGPLLLLAGAGSGKTRVLVHRIAYLIEEEQVNPWNIMAITFTNKAAGEMRERVDDMIGFGAENIWVSTFHSTCVRILRRHIDLLGYENSFTIYDTDDQKTLIKEVCKYLQIDTKQFPERALMNEISKAKDEFLSPSEYETENQGDFRKTKIASVYKEYQKRLKANNALDFDDLLFKAVELFQFHPEVLEKYQERFQYIMIDEYQDTNHVQFLFVSMLAGKYRNLCVVGDDDQSIYKFRGANIYNILNFEKKYEDAKVIKLEQNYRSTQNILNAANGVIRNNTGRKDKTLWTDNEAGKEVEFTQYDTEYEEAESIVNKIEELVKEGSASYQDMAILNRTNAQSRVFEEKFLLKNIPYKIVGGVNFYQRKEIKDLISYLKVINNGQDDLAVRRIINVPRRGIGLTTIDRIQEYALGRGISFLDAAYEVENIPSLARSVNKIREFTDLIDDFRKKEQELILPDLFSYVIEKTGYVEELEKENTEESLGRIENIDELLNKIAVYEQGAKEPNLNELLEEIALVADIDSLDGENEAVVIMTLHSAKGLEFPYVFMGGMEDGIFPSYMTLMSGDDSEIEEERRLCYVGITRAKKELYLSAAKRRMLRGQTQFNKVSQFIGEIPRELLHINHGLMRGVSGVTSTYRREGINGSSSFENSYMQKNPFMKTNPYKKQEFVGKQQESLSYDVGDTVQHLKFGKGVVQSIHAGGKDYEVTVDFEKAGVKKMFASFAKLKKV